MTTVLFTCLWDKILLPLLSTMSGEFLLVARVDQAVTRGTYVGDPPFATPPDDDLSGDHRLTSNCGILRVKRVRGSYV